MCTVELANVRFRHLSLKCRDAGIPSPAMAPTSSWAPRASLVCPRSDPTQQETWNMLRVYIGTSGTSNGTDRSHCETWTLLLEICIFTLAAVQSAQPRDELLVFSTPSSCSVRRFQGRDWYSPSTASRWGSGCGKVCVLHLWMVTQCRVLVACFRKRWHNSVQRCSVFHRINFRLYALPTPAKQEWKVFI